MIHCFKNKPFWLDIDSKILVNKNENIDMDKNEMDEVRMVHFSTLMF